MVWGRVGGRPAGARERGERTGRAGLGAGHQEEGRAGGLAEKILGLLGGDMPGYGTGRR